MTFSWDTHKDEIIRLYRTRPLHQVRQIMKDNYGFIASIRAYRSRLMKWEQAKYKKSANRRKSESDAIPAQLETSAGADSTHLPTHTPSASPASAPSAFGTPHPTTYTASPEMGPAQGYTFPIRSHDQYQHQHQQQHQTVAHVDYHSTILAGTLYQTHMEIGQHCRDYEDGASTHALDSTPPLDPALHTDQDATARLFAAIRGRNAQIWAILSNNPDAINGRDRENQLSTLHVAATVVANPTVSHDGIDTMVRRLLDCGGNARAEDVHGDSPLQFLFKVGAGVDTGFAWWQYPERLAAGLKLLEHSDVDHLNESGQSILTLALTQLHTPADAQLLWLLHEVLMSEPNIGVPMPATTSSPSPTHSGVSYSATLLPFNKFLSVLFNGGHGHSSEHDNMTAEAWQISGDILCQFLHLRADANAVVHGSYLLNYLLEHAETAETFGNLWGFASQLIDRADPWLKGSDGLNALHHAIGSGPAAAIARDHAAGASYDNRSQLKCQRWAISRLVERSGETIANVRPSTSSSPSPLDDPTPSSGETTLELYVRLWADDSDFLSTSMKFVQFGAALPLGNGFRTQFPSLAHFDFHGPSLPERDQDSCPLWVAIWLSACRQTYWDAVTTHLEVLKQFVPEPPIPDFHTTALKLQWDRINALQYQQQQQQQTRPGYHGHGHNDNHGAQGQNGHQDHYSHHASHASHASHGSSSHQHRGRQPRYQFYNNNGLSHYQTQQQQHNSSSSYMHHQPAHLPPILFPTRI